MGMRARAYMPPDAGAARHPTAPAELRSAGAPDAGRGPLRVVYDVVVAYGPLGARQAHLQEIALSGLSLRTAERIAHDTVLDVAVPAMRGDGTIALRGRVTGQRLSA